MNDLNYANRPFNRRPTSSYQDVGPFLLALSLGVAIVVGGLAILGLL